jgi:hypothetical protein
MNLLKYVHLQWAGNPALSGLLPVERVFTGQSDGPSPPYAAISKLGQRPCTRHGDGSSLERAALRVEIFSADYETGRAILDAVQRAFDGAAFDADENAKILDVRRTDETEKQLNLDHWRFAADYECLAYLPNGA